MAADDPTAAIVTELGEILRKGSKSIALPLKRVNEVYENVFVGGEEIAQNISELTALGITHILNCAQGPKFFHVPTDQDYYNLKGLKIKFCGLQVSDFPQSDIKQHFATAVEFIDQALAQENGKVLIHCVQGFSRSASVAIAYLMIRRGMTVQEATRTVREKREVGPNKGFLKQLVALNDDLQKK